MDKKLFQDFLDKKLHHSILFNGGIGDGQFNVALGLADRILIKDLNINNDLIPLIEEKKEREIAKIILDRKHPDLLIVEKNDGVKEIGVDVVKENIMDFMPLSPTLSANKILIINSIDEMNKNAQNAILKLLEEPQKNTYIFLICNNINNVIATVKSRCLVLHMPKLEYDDWKKNVIDGDLELYELSGHSVYYANLILDNDGIEIFNDMKELLQDKILNIEKLHLLADGICKNNRKNKKNVDERDEDEKGDGEQKFNLFCNFIMLILYKSLKFYTTEKISNDLVKFTKLNNEKMILNKIDEIKKIIRNTKTVNLSKKHSIIVSYLKLFE
ncbi:MAG: DNA polymerase III subunit [Rickettsiales bacterium]|jgi:DNA polymerase-3 subunit delta'|nr:DNA polymerase III subunit [Rickettsiales bacterium]